MLALPSTQRRSRFLFDWQPSRALGAMDWDLEAITGQAATLTRATAGAGTGSDGRGFSVAAGVPAFNWGALDYDDATVSVGLRLNGDALSFPFLVTPRALTVCRPG